MKSGKCNKLIPQTALSLLLLCNTVVFSAEEPATAGKWVAFSSDQGDFSVSSKTLRGTSGLTYLGENQFVTIDDVPHGPPQLHHLEIELNSKSGQVGSVRVTKSVPVTEGSEFEGIAWNRTAQSFYLVSEKYHSLRRVDETGKQLGSVPVPDIYQTAQPNKSLESLAFDPERKQLWIANEEPLKVDLPVGAVRLQRFTNEIPSGQFVYELEPPRNPQQGFNGLCELALLPDGKLLALERDLDRQRLNIAIRLFEIVYSKATDVSELKSLDEQKFTPVTKRILLDPKRFPDGYFMTLSNYESMAVGPQLEDGSWSLLLGPADDNDNGFLIPETVRTFKLKRSQLPE